ncbi:MAG: alpha-amylase [Candidatus Bathyarchaeia archaeon]
MPDICLCFEAHQPFRINKSFRGELGKGRRPEELFDIYFDNDWNRAILERVARKCYIPANEIMLENIDLFKGDAKKFKISLSLSGLLVEQLERWAPDAMDSFKGLARSGCVELLDQTYHHSLSSLFSADRGEFIEQVRLHRDLMRDAFGQYPVIFENTELLYNDSIAKTVERMGYRGIFSEGAERILGWRSPNYIYRADGTGMALLLRNYRLSDDIAFRFSNRDWPGWPLTADKYAAWLSNTPGDCINIFIDYETFGEHQWWETGIMEFLRWLPAEVLRRDNLQFKTPSELIASHPPVGVISVGDFETISWADAERSTSAWLGNDMQMTCYRALKGMEAHVKGSRDESLIRLWRLLQASDLLYYMYTQPGPSASVHEYFSSQPPAMAFWAFMRILSDLGERVAERLPEPGRSSALFLRSLPPDRAFHFHEGEIYVGLSAHSLEEFLDALSRAPEGSIAFHKARGDFEEWVGCAIGDVKLANDIRGIRFGDPAELRRALLDAVGRRISELRAGVASG